MFILVMDKASVNVLEKEITRLHKGPSGSRHQYQKRDADVVDAVPTRTGIKKALCEQSDSSYCFDDSTHEVQFEFDDNCNHDDCCYGMCSPILQSGTTQPRTLCCKVLGALFSCQFIFERYSIIDLSLNIGAIILFIFDFVTDWLNAFNAYLFRVDEKGQDYLFYFWLTAAVITVPSIVIQAMSFWWEKEDNREKKKQNLNIHLGIFYYMWLILFHLLQIAPVYRYLRTIYCGIKSRYYEVLGKEDCWKTYDDKYKAQLADVNFVRLLESFLESAPQVVLQIYLMIRTADVLPITVISVCVSSFGMSSCFVTYQRALRDTLEQKEQLTIFASIVLFLYRAFVNGSRVLALALLLNTSIRAWIFGLLCHWLLMTVLIGQSKTNFCNTRIKEYFYAFTIGFCYIFSYINVHPDEYNSYRMLGYYTLMFIENSFAAIAWFHYRHGGSLLSELVAVEFTESPEVENVLSTEVSLSLMVAVVGSFIIGMFFFVIYYLFLHPKAPVKLCQKHTSSPVTCTHLTVTDSARVAHIKKIDVPLRMSAIRKLYIPQNRLYL